MSKSSLVESAIYYADLGYPVFPCVPGGKAPATTRGLLDATTDAEQIEKWWDTNPDYNLAIRTDGLLVVDIDGDQNPWLTADIDRKIDLCDGCMSITPRGGSHIYFRGGEFRNTAGKLADKVDTRGNDGYVLVPPSRIEGSGNYQWAPFLNLDCRPCDLREPPRWLVDALSDSTARVTADDVGHVIPDGKRNSTLARIAGLNRQHGATEAEIRALLHAVNNSRCRPPLDTAEVDKIAWSIARHEPDLARTLATTGDLVDVSAITDPDDSDDDLSFLDEMPESPGEIPASALRPGGLLERIIDYNLAGSFRPQPKLALAGAIALVGTITGRRIQDRRGTRTNIYTIGVAASGAGKERARQVNKAILSVGGFASSIAPESFGSHAGIVSVMNESPVALFQVDEFGRYIATVNDPRGSTHLYKTVDVLLKLYSSANSLYIGDAYADLKKVARIEQPHACLYGTTVPKSLFESLNADSLTDGFLGRLLIFEGDPQPAKIETQPVDVPQEIIEAVAAWANFIPHGNLTAAPGAAASPYTVDDTADADDRFRQAEKLFDERARADKGGLGALWSRCGEKARKLALIHAASLYGPPDIKGGEVLVIDVDSAEWGCRLASHLTSWIASLSVDWISETPVQKRANQILRLIRASPGGMRKTELTYRTRGMTSRERDEALDQLEQSCLIDKETKFGGKGRNTSIYTATKA